MKNSEYSKMMVRAIMLSAIGDGIGATFEQSDSSALRRSQTFPNDGYTTDVGVRSGCDVAAKSGPAGGMLGWTDDTSMNLAVLRAVAGDGAYSPEAALAEYRVEHEASKQDHRAFTWGNVVSKALEQGRGMTAEDVRDVRRCGALMRAPSMLFCGPSSDRVNRGFYYLDDFSKGHASVIEKDVRLTHDDDDAVTASIAYVAMLSEFIERVGAYGGEDRKGSFGSWVTWGGGNSLSYLSRGVGWDEVPVPYGCKRASVARMLDAVADASALLDMGSFAVDAMIRYNGGKTTMGGLWPMFTSSLWLGMRLARALLTGNDIDEVIEDGIMVGGDVDTRLALAMPFIAWMSDGAYAALTKRYPPLWRGDEIERVAVEAAEKALK